MEPEALRRKLLPLHHSKLWVTPISWPVPWPSARVRGPPCYVPLLYGCRHPPAGAGGGCGGEIGSEECPGFSVLGAELGLVPGPRMHLLVTESQMTSLPMKMMQEEKWG